MLEAHRQATQGSRVEDEGRDGKVKQGVCDVDAGQRHVQLQILEAESTGMRHVQAHEAGHLDDAQEAVVVDTAGAEAEQDVEVEEGPLLCSDVDLLHSLSGTFETHLCLESAQKMSHDT